MMGTRWRRWWCVLEGRLLLYYKSQSECSNLSPCRGSLNMGLASCVTPARNFQLHVATRSQICVLKARNQAEQEQWLQALLDSMSSHTPHSSSVSSNESSVQACKPVNHFRYSAQLQAKGKDRPCLEARRKSDVNPSDSSFLGMNNHTPNGKADLNEEIEMKTQQIKQFGYHDSTNKNSEAHKLDKYSQMFVQRGIELDENFNLNEKKGSETFEFAYLDCNRRNRVTDFKDGDYLSDPPNFVDDTVTSQNDKQDVLKVNRSGKPKHSRDNSKFFEKKLSIHHCAVPEDSDLSENVDENRIKAKDDGYKEKKVSVQKNKSETNLHADPMGSVERIFTDIGKDTRITRRKSNEIKENILKMRSISDACLLKSIYDESILPFENELKKNSAKRELTPVNADTSAKSKSCENVYTKFKLVDSSQSSDLSLDSPQIKNNSRNQANKTPNQTRSPPKRSESFLRRLITPSSKGADQADYTKKRSFNIFQKLVPKRTSKDCIPTRRAIPKEIKVSLETATLTGYQQTSESDQSSNSSFAEHPVIPEHCKINSSFIMPQSPGPEPLPDYDECSLESDSDDLIEPAPELPPREVSRPKSPWHDIPSNNQPVESTTPPPLPLKLKRSPNSLPNCVNFIHPAQISTTDGLESDLIKPDFDDIISNNKKQDSGEVIYDVPRPHATLSLTLQEANLNYHNDTLTCGFRDQLIGEPDSLDILAEQIFVTETEGCITPDSLEINWYLRGAEKHQYDDQYESWISDALERNIICLGSEHFHDSLDFNGLPQSHLLQF